MELVQVDLAEVFADRTPMHFRRDGGWGPWKLDQAVFVLFISEPYRYEVDLERCTSSAKVLDYICQVARKTWCNTEMIGGLVSALDDVLTPQANLCSFGRSKRLSCEKIKRMVLDVADRLPK